MIEGITNPFLLWFLHWLAAYMATLFPVTR